MDSLLPFMKEGSFDASPLLDRLTEALDSVPFGEPQALLHETARRIAGFQQQLAAPINTRLADDLEIPPGGTTPERLEAVRELSSFLPEAEIRRIFASLPQSNDTAVTWTYVVVAGAARQAAGASWDRAAYPVSVEDVKAAAATASTEGDHAVAVWLGLDPSPAEVAAVADQMMPRAPEVVVQALQDWSARSKKKHCTALVQRLLSARADPSQWVEAATSSGVTEKPLLERLRKQMDDLKDVNRDERLRVARRMAALRPKTAAGQRALSDVVVWLLDKKRPKRDIEVGLQALKGLGPNHGNKRALDRAVEQASRRANAKLTTDQIADFLRAGIKVPDDWVAKSRRKKVMDAIAKRFARTEEASDSEAEPNERSDDGSEALHEESSTSSV